MPSKKRRATKTEEAERALFAPHRKPTGEVKEGLFRIEALSAACADYADLAAKHSCPDLALALSGAYVMGPITDTPLFLKTDAKYPWAGVVKWLNENVSHFNLRLQRSAEVKEQDDPIFGLIKLKGDKECSLYIQDEVYPPGGGGGGGGGGAKKDETQNVPAPNVPAPNVPAPANGTSFQLPPDYNPSGCIPPSVLARLNEAAKAKNGTDPAPMDTK